MQKNKTYVGRRMSSVHLDIDVHQHGHIVILFRAVVEADHSVTLVDRCIYFSVLNLKAVLHIYRGLLLPDIPAALCKKKIS